MNRHALAVLTLLGTAALASCDRAPTSARDSRQAGSTEIRHTGTANASVVAAVKLSGNYTLGVVASNNGSSVTSGTATVYSATADVSFSVDITCISKSGGHAKLSGTVNESSDPSIEGYDAYFEVTDGVPDQAGKVILAEDFGPTCLDSPEFDQETIAAGIAIVS